MQHPSFATLKNNPIPNHRLRTPLAPPATPQNPQSTPTIESHNTVLHQIEEHLAVVVGILTALGTLVALWRPIWKLTRRIMIFITAPRKIEDKVDILSSRFDRFLDAYSMHESTLTRIHKAIFNGGKNGILQNSEMNAAFSAATFETAPQPMFMCDNVDGNLKVNRAYRELVMVWRDDDIQGDQWIGVINGELKDDYLAEWARCSARGEDFFGDVGFHNPMTNELRGTWKIHAPAMKRADGSFLYVGTFTTALDARATDIATEKHWRVATPLI
jgi:hypothetical protein